MSQSYPKIQADGKPACSVEEFLAHSQEICAFVRNESKPVLLGEDLMLVQTEYERSLRHRITALQTEISFLKSKRQKEQVSWSKNGFNYLAIGNSITLHGYADYWWNQVGMAASSLEKDYVHLFTEFLREQKGEVTLHTFNFATWEVLATDRAETLELLDGYLCADLDLVTVQLGENAGDITTFESDFTYMLQYIQKAAPKARILVIGDFWVKEGRDEMKCRAAQTCGISFVSLDALKDNPVYQAGMGTTVYGTQGEAHTIEHAGVAAHPGDAGMAAIAEALKKAL